MTIRIPDTGVSPLVASQWYIESLKDELSSLDNRAKRVSEFPFAKVARAKRDAIDRCIRAQYYFGWAKGSITSFLGILYREIAFQKTIEAFLTTSSDSSVRDNMKEVEKTSTIEHVTPVAVLRDQLLMNSMLSDKDIAASLLSPVALLTKETEGLIKEVSELDDTWHPFRRYTRYGIQIVAHNNAPISENWSMKDHWNLVAQVPQFQEVINYYGIGNQQYSV